MGQSFNFKKELEKTKKQLLKFSQEAIDVAIKGEKELIKLSKQGKLHVDTTAIGLKKEKLYYLIGKEYVKAKAPQTPNARLKGYLNDLKMLNRQQRSLKTKMKKSNNKK